MATATQQAPVKKPTAPATPHEPPENGTVASRPSPATPAPAPAPAPVDTDEELRKSMEAEAQEVEQEEEKLVAGEQTASEDEPEEEDEDDQVSIRLLGAVKEVTDEIEECDSIIEKADNEYNIKIEQAEAERNTLVEKTEARREELKVQLQNAINKMQSKYGVAPKVRRTPAKAPATKKATNGRHDKSIRVLITEYLEKHRSARTSEIRSFLQSQGRTTNPGVELSRMVKDGSIVNKERGLYTLPRGK